MTHPSPHITLTLSWLTAAVLLTAGGAEAETGSRAPQTAQSRAGQTSPLRDFAGTYRYAGTKEHGRLVVRRAVRELMSQLPPMLRPILRQRTTDRDYLVHTIAISTGRRRVSTRVIAYKTMAVSSRPGEVRVFTSRSGNETRVLQRLADDGAMEVSVENRRGKMLNRLTLHDEGRRLRVDATFTSPLLYEPVSLTLEYDRVARPRRSRPSRQVDRHRPRRRISPAAVSPRRQLLQKLR